MVLISTYVPEHGAEQGAERSRYLDIGAEQSKKGSAPKPCNKLIIPLINIYFSL